MIELASRKTILQADSLSGTRQQKQAILKYELMPERPSLAEIMSHTMRTGNKSSLTDFLTERVNPTSRKCCFAHRWLISLEAAIGKQEKANRSEGFRAAGGLCVTERVWTVRGSLC